jgi:hypothetical protein
MPARGLLLRARMIRRNQAQKPRRREALKHIAESHAGILPRCPRTIQCALHLFESS